MELKTIIEDAGFSLYDEDLVRENGRLIYRILLAKKGGVSLDDCTKVHHLISPILDVYEPTKEEYFLEVSSCGLERNLKNLEQCRLSIGELVRLKDADKAVYEGELLGVNEGEIIVKTDEGEKSFDFKSLKKIRTFIRW